MGGKYYKNQFYKKIEVVATDVSETKIQNEEKKHITSEQICELQIYLSKLDATKEGNSGAKIINRALVTQKVKGNVIKNERIIDNGTSDHMT